MPRPFTSRLCGDCDQWFTISRERLEWFKQNGLRSPNTCPRCRQARTRALHEQPGLITFHDVVKPHP